MASSTFFLNGVDVSGDLIQTSRHRREFRPIPVPLAFEQGILIDQLLFDPTQSLAFFSGAFLAVAIRRLSFESWEASFAIKSSCRASRTFVR
jgi:hypothetical protein